MKRNRTYHFFLFFAFPVYLTHNTKFLLLFCFSSSTLFEAWYECDVLSNSHLRRKNEEVDMILWHLRALLGLFLFFLVLLFFLFPLLLGGKLVRSPHSNSLWLIVAEVGLQYVLHKPTANVIQYHGQCEPDPESRFKWNQSEFSVELWDKFSRARQRYTRG